MKLLQHLTRLFSNQPVESPGRAIESLEPRRLLSSHGEIGPEPVADGFAANINFQPDTVGPVENTRADFGRPFGLRGNGLSYGWSRDLEAAGAMVDADSDRDLPGLRFGGNIGNGPPDEAQDVDERYDTFARVENGDEWSIDVPNGHYVVGFTSGDPDFEGFKGSAALSWSLNTSAAMLTFPTSDYPWGEAVAYTEIVDGRLRLTATNDSIDNTLMFARIVQIQPPIDYPQGQEIDWEDSPVEVPTSRIEPGVVRHDDKLFVIGGFTDFYEGVTRRVDILDLDTLEWTQGAPLPDAAAQTHAGIALDEANGQIYWIGGQLALPEFDTTLAGFRYDIAADSWEQVFDGPTTAYAPGAAVIGNQLHLFGGSDSTRIHPLAEHFIMDLAAFEADPAAADWRPAAFLPVPVDHAAVKVIDGLIYAVGGEYSHSVSYVPRPQVQIYDPAGDAWSLGQQMPEPVSHQEGTSFVHEGRIWVLGGKQIANRGTSSVQSYDPVNDMWATHTSAPFNRFGGVAFERNGLFYYLAGDDSGNRDAQGGAVGTLVG